jgi:PAS domain S-box-containing protein
LQVEGARIWTLSRSGSIESSIRAGAAEADLADCGLQIVDFENAMHNPQATIRGGLTVSFFAMHLGGKVSGVLGIYSQGGLSSIVQQRLLAIANQLAVGIARLRTAQSLQEALQNLRALIDAAPLAIFAIDAQQRITTWNPAAERTFGWKAAAVLGEPPPVVPPEKQTEFQMLVERDLRGQPTSGLETQWQTRDGKRIDLNLYTAPIYDAHGSCNGSIMLIVDTTEGKKLEEQYRQAQKMEAVGRLAGGVAHDFNNLLTVITGYSDMLKTQLPSNDPLWPALDEISMAADRAASLTQQLLTLSRKQVLVRRPLDLNALVTDAAKLLRRLIGEDIELVTRLRTPLRLIMGDVSQINQIILNLAVNARDAMPHGGKLTIETSNVDLEEDFLQGEADVRAGPFVLLSLSDTGVGIPADVLPNIFEPFFTTKGTGKGTGLGLATVYGIVRQSEGLIRVDTQLGKGATFRLYFPQAQGTPAQPVSRPSVPGVVRSGHATVLLIEDDNALRSLARMVLEGHGYKVLEARSGSEALAICGDIMQQIDLVVSDVVMPGLSGRMLGETILRLRPAIRILYMSGYIDDTLTRHGVEAGMHYLQKPFTPQGLLRKIREVLDAEG